MIICRQVRGSNPVRETVNEEKGDNCRGGGKFCKGKRRWNPEYKRPLVGTGKTEQKPGPEVYGTYGHSGGGMRRFPMGGCWSQICRAMAVSFKRLGWDCEDKEIR